MAQTAYPLSGTPATVQRWARMARTFATPHVVGTPFLNSYGATVSGLNLTIGRGTTGVAEAWVRAFFHVLDAEDWVLSVPANTATQARIDRVVLRMNLNDETVALTHVQGTPAASPVAPDLKRTDAVWDLPLWRFTVPANSGAPLTSLVDDRRWIDPDTGGTGLYIAAATSDHTTSVASTSTVVAIPGTSVLVPAGTYHIEAATALANGTSNLQPYLYAAGPTSTPTGAVLADHPGSGSVAQGSASAAAWASAGTGLYRGGGLSGPYGAHRLTAPRVTFSADATLDLRATYGAASSSFTVVAGSYIKATRLD